MSHNHSNKTATTTASYLRASKKSKITNAFLDPNTSDSSTSSLSNPPSDSELDQTAAETAVKVRPRTDSSATPGSRRARGKHLVPVNNSPSAEPSDSEGAIEDAPKRKKTLPIRKPAAPVRPQGGVGRTAAELAELLELPAVQPADEANRNTFMKLSYEGEEFGKPPSKELKEKLKQDE